jgi:hypothetical protein
VLYKIKVIKTDKKLRIKKFQHKASCLLASGGGANGDMDILCFPNGTARRITAIEAERLQCLPANYTSAVSASRRHVLLGNSFTASIISHILKNLKIK